MFSDTLTSARPTGGRLNPRLSGSGFNPTLGVQQVFMHRKNMFDPYICIAHAEHYILGMTTFGGLMLFVCKIAIWIVISNNHNFIDMQISCSALLCYNIASLNYVERGAFILSCCEKLWNGASILMDLKYVCLNSPSTLGGSGPGLG